MLKIAICYDLLKEQIIYITTEPSYTPDAYFVQRKEEEWYERL